MLKKIGIVTAAVTAGLLAIVPFAAATEEPHASAETTDCGNGNDAHTGSASEVININVLNFNCAQLFSNNGEANLGSNNPDSSITDSNNSDSSVTDSNNPDSSVTDSNNPDSSSNPNNSTNNSNNSDTSSGLQLPGFG